MSANITKYRKAFDSSQIFLNHLQIDEFPIDFSVVFAKCSNIVVSNVDSYNEWTLSRNKEPLDIQDAKCFYYPDRDTYWIAYNDKRAKTRIRFSIAHEIGHIVLGHLDDQRTEISRGGIDDLLYFFLESEANTFAGNFLAPPIVIDDWLSGKKPNSKELAKKFNISAKAATEYRIEDYKRWKLLVHSDSEQAILKRYRAALSRQICAFCNAVFAIEHAEYCPICGINLNKTKSWIVSKRGFRSMKYEGPQVDEYGRLAVCPVCKNEKRFGSGTFCVICGTSLVNKCEDDACNSGILPSTARHCPYCGKKSTYFVHKLLTTWDETETPNQTEHQLSQTDNSSITALEDDDYDLPF